MKTKYILLLAALAVTFVLSGCKQNEPFDTQSSDDAPLILVPYETKSGLIGREVTNPATYVDSVIVTPSRYTTVNWYLDNDLVFTGMKIDMSILSGKYALTIEAVTTAGKRTTRSGSLIVNPAPDDPYSAAPSAGRHIVPGMPATLEGKNLSHVKEIVLTGDVFGQKVVKTITPASVTDTQLEFTLPEMEDGAYYVRLKDEAGKHYGADMLNVHNGVLAISGYEVFTPLTEWVITGVNLKNVVSVKVGEVEITELTATTTTVTFTAPDLATGEYKLSMRNADGSPVHFGTGTDAPTEVVTRATLEITLWSGEETLAWDADRIKVTADEMANVQVGSKIYVYFSVLPDGDPGYFDPEKGELNQYQVLRVTTPWWDGYDLVPQTDMSNAPSPFIFDYTDDCKTKVTTCGAMSLVGWGLKITKITCK